MADEFYKPETISVQTLIALKQQKIKPIDGLNIPNITIPTHLASKKRATEANSESLVVITRQLFNSVTKDNIAQIKEQFRQAIIVKVQSEKMIEEVAEEMLQNFMVNENNIIIFMNLLNAVSPACILITSEEKQGPGKNLSSTIGNIFLKKCRDTIFSFISEDNIRELAKIDQDDSDQLDIYNRQREKIINLIVTICCLYEQRHTPNIKLTALQLYNLMTIIFEYHNKLQQKMKDLGNPYNEDEECKDEEEYEICRKMCNLYAEHLYTFMYREAKEFAKDPDQINGQTMKSLIDRFKNDIVPNITEEYLRSKCQDIEY